MGHMKKQSFAKGILILFISQIIIKLLGFVYRVVITGFEGFGDIGNSYFGSAFQVYTVILALSTVGIPAAIAKLVSEKVAIGDAKEAHRIFKIALKLFTVIGLAGTAIMFIFAGVMSDFVSNPGLKYSLWALAPSVFFVAVASVVRGYFQGYCNMKPQAGSQIIDQVAKCLFTIALAWAFLGRSAEQMAAAATFGSTIGTVVSMVYLIIYYYKKRDEIWKGINSTKITVTERQRKIIKNILLLSIPIAFGAVITSIGGMVNLVTVLPRLLSIEGMSTERAQRLYGILVGKSDTLLNLPLALNVAYATSLVPNIAAALAVGNSRDASRKISFSIFSTILITLPAAVGLSVLADPIIKTIFPTASEGGFYLQVSAYSLIFIALTQTIGGALQGMGKVYSAAFALLIGATVKYIMNYILVAIPGIEIMGAAYSSIICYAVAFAINFIILRKNIDLKLNFKKYILKPTIAVAAMGLAAYYSHMYLLNLLKSMKLATAIAICLAGGVYGGMLLLLKTFDDDDARIIPGLNKLIRNK